MSKVRVKTVLKSHTIQFAVNSKKKEFTIIHNMPDQQGLRIKDALDNWLARTTKFTAEDFIEYINSKNTGAICMTEEKYKNLTKIIYPKSYK